MAARELEDNTADEPRGDQGVAPKEIGPTVVAKETVKVDDLVVTAVAEATGTAVADLVVAVAGAVVIKIAVAR